MPSTTHRDPSMLSIFAALAASATFLLALAGIVAVSARSDTTLAASAPVPVTLSEFKIVPATINAAGHVQLAVSNGGMMVHNLSLPELGKKTRDLGAGQSQILDLGNPKPGTYKALCEIPGHATSGMVMTLVVSAGSAATPAAAGDTAAGDPNDPVKLKAESDAMIASFKAFPAATKGTGNVPLAPVIEADGTKVFSLRAAITDWEVEPGKVVKAWTYNGTVPGPLLKVNVGDHVKVTLSNDLPGTSTDLHLHGIDPPFAMDGVSPLTQAPIPPGGTFTYDFTATTVKMGMYHAHLMGETAVPNGLFGVFQVGELPLPAGRTISGIAVPRDVKVSQELPMVLNDAGVIGLSLDGKSFPATKPMVANKGDWIQVTYFNEGLQVHTMHLHRFPQIVIAKDGMPLDQPYAADTLSIGPGERYTVILDAAEAGTWVWHCHILNHVESAKGMFGMVTALVVK